LPALPGLPLIFGGILLFDYAHGFSYVGPALLGALLGVTILGLLVDHLSAAWGAHRAGGSRAGLVGATLGTLVGLFFIGPIGLLFGPLAGAILGELMYGAPLDQAVRVGMGSLVGFLGGALVKAVLAIGMIFVFVSRLF